MLVQLKKIVIVLTVGMILFTACVADKKSPNEVEAPIVATTAQDTMEMVAKKAVIPQQYHKIEKDVTTGQYFDFIDDLVAHLDTTLTYPIDEYVLVRANPWLIDTLVETDYYRLQARGKFVYDPQSIQILAKGDSLLIPSAEQVQALRDRMAITLIDVNIPEFVLRIKEGEETIHQYSVRVGKNTQRYLAMAGRKVDLRTQPGIGEIVRISRDPAFINPRNNKRYSVTNRDDKKVTKLPRIPWLEPEINGQRFGQLIHPTTNITTLGKSYSNGCVGTSEEAAWRIYFHAPIGTKVQFRYDLDIVNEQGDSIRLKDIYPGFKKTKKVPVYASMYASLFDKLFSGASDLDDFCGCDLE